MNKLLVVTYQNTSGSGENNYNKENAPIPDALKRLFQFPAKDKEAANDINKTNEMSMKVTTKPNPFYTSVTLDITCEQNRHIIVRMFDEAGRIIKMLSWYVMKGSNITSLNELNILSTGQYFLDIIDPDGTVLFNTSISKQ